MSIQVLEQDSLPWSTIAREFVGDDHGGFEISFLIIDAEPGKGARLHKHAYEELIIVLEGPPSTTAMRSGKSGPARSC